jgi:hypothetical protein
VYSVVATWSGRDFEVMATTDRHDQAIGGQFSLFANILARLDVLQIARCVTFLATVLAIWVSLRPFPDLTATDFADVESGKFATTYITLGMLSIVAVALAAYQNLKAFQSLMTPAFLLLCCWIGINTLFSHDVGLSFQRLILTTCVVAMAASLLLLPHSQAELEHWLSAAALILLALCYLGVLLAPTYSMHTAGDMFEEHLAGDWRGPFGHKNVAAPIMAMLIFVGLYLISRKSLISVASCDCLFHAAVHPECADGRLCFRQPACRDPEAVADRHDVYRPHRYLGIRDFIARSSSLPGLRLCRFLGKRLDRQAG